MLLRIPGDSKLKLAGSCALIAVLFSLAQQAQSEPAPIAPPQPCLQAAMTQLEITACAEAAAAHADQRLNHAYDELMRYLDGEERDRLASSERAWVAFRDADCAFWGYGDFSLAPTNRAYCQADLSNDRAKELESWPPNAPRSALVPHN
jgi:uncharacterized protein YecT (DUF1311 family)